MQVLFRHLLLAGFALFCAGAAVIFSMDMIIMPYVIKAGTETGAPNLAGMTVAEAERLVKSKRFRLWTESQEYNMKYPENTISFQYPAPGTLIKTGRRIRVIVSLGPRPISMPNVVGKSRRDAGYIMKSLGLGEIKYVWIHSGDYVRGIVAGQHPSAGEKIPETADVVLSISDGIPETMFIMPNLVELSFTAALDTLKSYGFNINRVTIQREEAQELLPDTVIDQHPDPGTAMNDDEEVNMVISTSQ